MQTECVTVEASLQRTITAVSVAKKNDLLKLCRSGIIKKQHHQFYEKLRTGADNRDCLPEPDYVDDVDEEHF